MNERLQELAAAYDVPPAAVDALRRILELVASDDTAPTTVREPARAVDVHVADSLSGLELDAVRSARTIADLGAGAGFPGLALAAALPDAQVSLVESVGRKCAFMERAIEASGLRNASVVCRRAEEWEGGNDLVTARALAPLAVIAEYAAPLLRVGGSLVAWKGARDRDEETDAAVAAEELGLELVEVRRVSPFPGAEQRYLHLYSKASATPPRFPRRPGMARKHPLGRST
ncbi:MAG TPA: 16S rRNA (guanine(527)-N(7))-methyltransferase RsmG [Solirubrobacteraceae bacterium]|nr:16S rRNA (guanine(527)-N(7))-methyltransferase RsmG [Solirubrobacteraceae bacterium]